ncbi:hypothetical protein [Kitasatospora sp. GAS1066B]|uniref:hypothetical protein n=1 Tax=Kitasatospora sp. GAS1066B TaxID=3156271 RepID=UPI0035130884
MFEVRKSIRRFREDPAWAYQRAVTIEYPDWNPLGYPFSAGSFRDRLHHVLRGQVAGYPVTLGYVVVSRPGAPSGSHSYDFSIATLELPRAFPDTAMTEFDLARHAGSKAVPIPRASVEQLPQLAGGRKGTVNLVSVDAEFGKLLLTEEIERLTVEAGCGWRIDRSRLIGWVRKRRSYEELIGLAETMAAVTAAFPPAVWQWPA